MSTINTRRPSEAAIAATVFFRVDIPIGVTGRSMPCTCPNSRCRTSTLSAKRQH
jgi:hypothetical protein